MLLSARIDEAGTDGKSRCLNIGGFIATIPDWNRFDAGWRKRLKRVGMSDFHATDFWENQTAAARKLNYVEKNKFVRSLWVWQNRCLRFAFTNRLDNDDYEHYCSKRPNWLHRDSQYGLCFRLSVGVVINQSSKFFGDAVRVNFLLENGHRNVGDVERIFGEMEKDDDADFTKKLGTFSTGRRQDCPGLQAADGIISTAQRIENKGEEKFTDVAPDATLKSLSTPTIPAPVLRAHFQRDTIDKYLEGRVRYREEKQRNWLARRAAKQASLGSGKE